MELTEKCGVFGVFSTAKDAARLVYYGLWALQHRGQENSGIASTDGKKIYSHKARGLVAHVYTEANINALKGSIAIGHNRYSTSGAKDVDHSQPVTNVHAVVALAHNGNLPRTLALKNFLQTNGIPITGMNDSEMMHKALEYYLVKGATLKDALTACFPLFTGAFSLVIMTKNELVAVRDKYGIRPLCMGKINGDTLIFSSETCALDAVGATYIRDIKPGEMLYVNKKGRESIQIAKPEPKFDVFEFIYFARPDSQFFGKSVYEVRKNLGIELAKDLKKRRFKPDTLIPVPDSSIPAAIGLSQELKVPLEQLLVKNRYIHRTFIKPSQKQRTSTVKMKLNLIGHSLTGKSIGIVDDSIVRGTTSRILVQMLKKHKPREIHLLIPAPPVLYPDFYGIDTPKQTDLIASRMSHGALVKHIGATSITYLSYDGMLRAVGVDENLLCTACFTGEYPIDIGLKNKKGIREVTIP